VFGYQRFAIATILRCKSGCFTS